MPTLDQLHAQLDRLAAFDAGPFPVVSLYLDLRPNAQGRDSFEPFLRKELDERIDTWGAAGPDRDSLDRDAATIRAYLADVDAALNGLALFTCSGAHLFEAMPLAAPVDTHLLYIADEPHLYPLARLLDQFPRYAAVVADTHSARIFVFAANTLEKTARVESPKTKRHKMGGWSQARFQRHVENFHVQHAKEVVDVLGRVVRDDGIDTIVVAGDEVIVPLLREQMPKDVADRVVDVVRLDIRASDREVLETTIAALREQDAESDRERVDELIDAYRGNGLACAGVDATRRAFEIGQVDELFVPADPAAIRTKAGPAEPGGRSSAERTGDELVMLARQTSARVRVIEDAALLEPIGGVGAFLRFKV
jgi:peptide chain release factor subunit 1